MPYITKVTPESNFKLLGTLTQHELNRLSLTNLWSELKTFDIELTESIQDGDDDVVSAILVYKTKVFNTIKRRKEV